MLKERGITEEQIKELIPSIEKGHKILMEARKNEALRIQNMQQWLALPYQEEQLVNEIIKTADDFSAKYENIISFGIGGSFLGNQMLQDALKPSYWNEYPALRCGRPRIYFEGRSMDGAPLEVLLNNLDPKKTGLIIISKSGGTTEPRCGFESAKKWLKDSLGDNYKKQIIAVTDPNKGDLRSWINQEKGIITFPLPEGVGGRFSVLSPSGLLTAALTGIDIKALLAGAEAMDSITKEENIFKNPAYMYAALQTIAYKKFGAKIAIMMPFARNLKSLGEWYVQLLAESLGKKHDKQGKVVNLGRTPIPSVGNEDLHSTQQNNIEGEYNKTITFIKVKERSNLAVPKEEGSFLAQKSFDQILDASLEATAADLVNEKRMNCTLEIDKVDEARIGELIFFFEIATAMEGELLNLNTYDQPGVEGYKNKMFGILGKRGSEKAAQEVNAYKAKQDKKFII